MEGDTFDELDFFEALRRSGARALLIGRRALVALGLPVLTSDYDLWAHPDDLALLNRAVEALDFVATHTPEEARARGRYVLEDGAHVDVLVARQQSTRDGEVVRFDDVWSRRQALPVGRTEIQLPCIEDLIRTKRWSMRPKDVQDIQMLENLRRAT